MRLLALARGLGLVAALLGCGSAFSQACPAIEDITSVTRIVESATDKTLLERATVSVPDRLPLAWRSEKVRVRYELELGACAAAPAAALWVFRVGAPYRISTAAGEPLALMSANAMAATGSKPRRMDDPEGLYNGRIPALFALPPGSSRVTIELQTLTYMPPGVVRLAMGPTNLLLPVHTASVRSVVGYADAGSGVVLVISLVCLLLWLPRRADLNLLWLSAACGLWGARGLIYFNNVVPGQPLLFEQLNPVNALLAAATIAAAALHLIRPAGRRRSAMQVLLVLTLMALGGLLAAALTGSGAAIARTVAQVTGTGFICWLGVEVWLRRRFLPPHHTAGLIACVLALLGCVVHDLMVVAGALPATSGSWVFWGFVVVLTGFALMSGEYVVATLNRAEHSNEELELHVARKATELEHSYARLRESEHATARAQERERLLRDMHDGLGAQLMTALRGVERGALSSPQIAQSLQDSLDELRLLMDSTDMGHYLPGALAAWRNRWDGKLAAAGVTLDWRIDESLDQVQLSSETALQVMRILQEAAANVVKHSQARRMGLSAQLRQQPEGRRLCIEITDDGVGLGPEPARTGARGLKNMRYRAGEIGAELSVEAVAAPQTGCRVLLSVPVA